MKTLKVPSLQHLSRNWHPDCDRIHRDLVNLWRHSPTFSYDPLYRLLSDRVRFGQPDDQLVKCLRQKESREYVLSNYLEILPLLTSYLDDLNPDFVQPVQGRLYPISRGLMVPFNPPLVAGVQGKLLLPWFNFWKNGRLEGEQLRLFVSVIVEILRDDPDLEDAELRIVDFSSPALGEPRALRTVDISTIPVLSADIIKQRLEIFAKGFQLAEITIAQIESESTDSGSASISNTDAQMILFEK